MAVAEAESSVALAGDFGREFLQQWWRLVEDGRVTKTPCFLYEVGLLRREPTVEEEEEEDMMFKGKFR